MTWLIVAIVVFVAVLAVVGIWALRTANRLDRLNVGYDLSWQALDHALARRAVVARAVAIDAYGGSAQGRRLAALADAAERADRNSRENAENELSTALAMVDAGLGVSVLPTYAWVATHRTAVVALPLTSPTISRDIALITQAGRSVTPALSSFMRVLAKHIDGSLPLKRARAG